MTFAKCRAAFAESLKGCPLRRYLSAATVSSSKSQRQIYFCNVDCLRRDIGRSKGACGCILETPLTKRVKTPWFLDCVLCLALASASSDDEPPFPRPSDFQLWESVQEHYVGNVSVRFERQHSANDNLEFNRGAEEHRVPMGQLIPAKELVGKLRKKNEEKVLVQQRQGDLDGEFGEENDRPEESNLRELDYKEME
ncbi:hypothetical protein L596_003206 [Steinernema carpocapsae]|uniref:Uncharacterized protein n=1 Tax=Steinernema carpocapsae TaxID=34508 RepID=A0A4U8UUQ3_STECR|nr:hypothetical protein L596_003206 [Steinernema carpocapsae]